MQVGNRFPREGRLESPSSGEPVEAEIVRRDKLQMTSDKRQETKRQVTSDKRQVVNDVDSGQWTVDNV